MASSQRLCKICDDVPSKYLCPRCGIPYCSLKCYQNLERHIKCSESFYRDCVVENIQQEEDPLKAKKMQEVLQRFHEQYDGDGNGNSEEELQDSDDDEPLAKRMEGVNLDDADEVWNSLTREEREDFKRFINQNDGKDIIPEWTPWWTLPVKNLRIREVTEGEPLDKDIHEEKLNEEQPDHLDLIPSLSSLTTIKPSDSVRLGLANVLGAYAWTSRLFSGDIVRSKEPEEVAFALISLSSCLSKDQVFSLYEEAVSDVSLNACKNPELLDGGPSLPKYLNDDVLLILRSGDLMDVLSTSQPTFSKSFVLSALTECYKLLSVMVTKTRKIKVAEKLKRAGGSSKLSQLRDSSTERTSNKAFSQLFPTNTSEYALDPKIYNRAMRKIYYLLAYMKEVIW